MITNSGGKNHKRAGKNFICIRVLLLLCVLLSCFVLSNCVAPQPNGGGDEDNNFDAAAFYEVNTVEIAALDKFGEINSGTGLIIAGEEFPVIVTNLHVAGKYGGLITVRFFGETMFVNTNTISNDNKIEVLAFSETLDLCIFKVDYKPATIYNDLTKEILETNITPFSQAEVAVGQKVTSLGNVGGDGIKKFEGKITKKESLTATKFGNLPLIQTSLAIAEGCSGGAMFGSKGEFLGLTSFADNSHAYSIPAKYVQDLYDTLEN